MKYISFDHFFTILGNRHRVKLLQLLSHEGPMSVSAMTRALKSDQSAVSHTLRQLLECHFVTVEQVGKNRIYSINADTVKPLFEQIDRHVRKYCAKDCEHWER
jgi:DNA-binding transcriptional ArsR family regulator